MAEVAQARSFRTPWAAPAGWGAAAAAGLLGVYFAAVSAISGWAFAADQFALYWPYIVALALGFGIQVALYRHLRTIAAGAAASRKVVAATGTASTGAMISCCAHYLVNVLPVLGVTGALAAVAQYQVELFWVGLASNLAGIAYIGSKVAGAAGHGWKGAR